ILSNETNVCNEHGNCTDFNMCSCELGWTSNDCSVPMCFGKSATDEEVCSGRGKCVWKNQYLCDSRSLGIDCSKDRLIVLYLQLSQANIYSLNWICLIIVMILLLIK